MHDLDLASPPAKIGDLCDRRDDCNGGRDIDVPQLEGREEKEKREILVLETFLPKALSPEELEQLVKATIQELSATSKKQMGPVIKAVQTKAAGRADGKSISALVGKLLPVM